MPADQPVSAPRPTSRDHQARDGATGCGTERHRWDSSAESRPRPNRWRHRADAGRRPSVASRPASPDREPPRIVRAPPPASAGPALDRWLWARQIASPHVRERFDMLDILGREVPGGLLGLDLDLGVARNEAVG